MISIQDRSGYFGASDTKYIIGNFDTKTFKLWWLEKLGIRHNSFKNRYTLAGTYYEHKILDSLGIDIEKDKQIIIDDLKLRVNLDGNTEDTIYEVKTYCADKAFNSKQYIGQVMVQMYASGYRKAYIVSYGLTEYDYKNFFNPIDKDRLSLIPIEYDESFINDIYLPRLKYLCECLHSGKLPCNGEVNNYV